MESRPVVPSKKALDYILATVPAFGGFTVLTTKNGRIVYASELASRLLGRREELTHPDLRAVAAEAWKARAPITRSCHVASLGPFQDVVIQAGVVEGRWVLLSVVDRTEEVRAVQMRRDFVSNIGHELRTPVTSLGLIAQALSSCAADPAAVEHFAGRLAKVTRRLERLADGMLALAQAQGSGPSPPLAVVSVTELMDQAAVQALETARGRGVKLRIRKQVDAHVAGDYEALIAALENLLANAIQYSVKGSRVTFSSEVDWAEGRVSIHVKDQGIGIAVEDQERIFERFYRTDSARSRHVGGTGLGLAIVKHTALAHGGTVTVDSHEGSGSSFTLILPVVPPPPEEPSDQVAT
jgi:two-component system sensor histidine kinase SenX3